MAVYADRLKVMSRALLEEADVWENRRQSWIPAVMSNSLFDGDKNFIAIDVDFAELSKLLKRKADEFAEKSDLIKKHLELKGK